MIEIETIQIIISAVTGSGVTAIVLACIQRRWQKQDKQDAIVAALKVLMVDRVRYLGQKYVSEGYISLSDKETIQDMHSAYKALGGNGHLNTIMGEVEELPLRKET